jgi:hypothetical protein
VWQLIAEAEEWTSFSDNLDFVDDMELAAAISAEATARDEAIETAVGAVIADMGKAALSDEAASDTLPATTLSAWDVLMQTVRNCLKWLSANKQAALNRTVGGNDNASGTVTDKGGNLSVPVPLTTAAPSASSTQTAAGTDSLRAKFKILVDNIAWLFTNKQDKLTTDVAKCKANRKVDEVLIEDWKYGDGSRHILAMIWAPNAYSGSMQTAQYAIRMWAGSSSTSWTIWAVKMSGDGTLSFSNSGTGGVLKIVPTSGTTSGFDYGVQWT